MKKVIGAYVVDSEEIIKVYEDDINTIEGLKKVFTLMKNSKGAFSKGGIESLHQLYTTKELEEANMEVGLYDYNIFEDELEYFSFKSIKDILVYDDKKLRLLLSGFPVKDYHIKKPVFLINGRKNIDFSFLAGVASDALQNIMEGHYDDDIFYNVWHVRVFDFVNWDEILENGYITEEAVVDFFDYTKLPYERFEYAYEHLSILANDYNKPLLDRDLTEYEMISILKALERYQDAHSEHRKTLYVTLMDRLIKLNNYDALEIAAYAYYCGNSYVERDFKKSEEYLLKLMNIKFYHGYANSLGYIYYYGRVNNGIPEYEKAYKYYSMAALVGNIESCYKLGDMYLNGYYVDKNKELAKEIYENLYDTVLADFYRDETDNNLADVALRIASFYANAEDAYYAAKMLIEASLAISLRDNIFDGELKKTISNRLKNLYSEYGDIIRYCSNIFSLLYHWKSFYVERIDNVLRFTSDVKYITLDLASGKAYYLDTLSLEFNGAIIKDFKGKTKVNDFKVDDKGVFSFYYNKHLVGKLEMLDIKLLLDNKAESVEKLYDVARCKVDDKEEIYLLAESGDINDNWEVVETGESIYPYKIEAVYENELPYDASLMKHAKKTLVS